MVLILFAQLEIPLSHEHFNAYVEMLPVQMRHKIHRFRFRKDASLSLVGKMLLIAGMRMLGNTAFSLDQIVYSPFNRPFIEGKVDYNISHSGNIVTCAISEGCRIGIDIEKEYVIELDDFREQWTREEWEKIDNDADKPATFFAYWTRKEAVIKGDGRGMAIPLKDFQIIEDVVRFGKDRWFLKKLHLAEGYASHIAVDIPLRIAPRIFRICC